MAFNFIKRTFSTSAARLAPKRKRFYQRANVTKSNGKYEIYLDQRKLKTPQGRTLELSTEPLALAVAHEWNSQRQFLETNSMHLTALCNTATDNPMQLTQISLCDLILQFIDTDTVCIRDSEPEELAKLQERRWDPLLEWFGKRFGVELPSTSSLGGSLISNDMKSIIQRHLLSYNFWSLIGIHSTVECLKSVVLSLATMDRHLSSEDAVSLSRLETEFQTTRWGSVEWGHELDLVDLRARVAASSLFVYLNCESTSLRIKSK